MSTISSITVLNRFNVKDASVLEEKVVDLGINEVCRSFFAFWSWSVTSVLSIFPFFLLRLHLVHVKYFPEMLFSCVWLYYENFSRKYFHVFGNILKMLFSTTTHTKPITTTKKKIRDQREKVKNQNHKQILLQKFQMRTRTRLVMGSRVYGFVGLRCDSPVRSVRCDSRFVGLRCNDLGFLGSRSLSLSLSLSLCLHVWVLSLSLSLFARLRKWFEGKILAENIFRVKGLNFTVNWNSFPENPFSMRNQTPAFPEKHFQKWFEVKTNTALAYFFR